MRFVKKKQILKQTLSNCVNKNYIQSIWFVYYIPLTISHFLCLLMQISCALSQAQSQFKPCSISSCKLGNQLAGQIHAFSNQYRAAIALKHSLRGCFFAGHTFTALKDCRIAVVGCRPNVNSLLLCILRDLLAITVAVTVQV